MAKKTPAEIYAEIAEFTNNTTGDNSAGQFRDLITNVFDTSYGGNGTYVTTPSDLGPLVGGFYELEEGAYFWDSDMVIPNNIKFITENGRYYFTGLGASVIVEFTAAGNSIENIASGIWFQIDNLFFKSTTADNVIYMDTCDSLIQNFVLFTTTKKPFTLLNAGFLTMDAHAFVECDDGADISNVDIITMNRPQWSSGTNLSGTAFTIEGPGSRLIVGGIECEAQPTEFIFKIDNNYTGLASMTSGAFSDDGGSFFDPTGKDQTVPGINVLNITGVSDSDTFAFSHVDVLATTTITTTSTPVKLNAVWLDIDSSRITVDSTGIWTYDDIEPSKLTINAALSLDPGSINQEIECQIWKNGVFVDHTEHQSIMDRGGQLIIFAVVPVIQGDEIEIYIQNNTSNANIDTTKGSFKIG